MFGKHIKAACLAIVVCLIAVMFFTVTILNGQVADVANPVCAIILLVFVTAAIVPIFIAHEKHN